MEKEYHELVNEVFKQIGRNVLIFQQIEKGLKLLLPYIHSDGSQKGIDSFRSYKKANKSQTLGNLINSLIDSCEYDSDYFVENLKKVVANRNKLIHHFGESEGINILATKEGCLNCIADLESQHQEALSFYQDIKLFVLGVLYLLRENYAESHPKIDLLYKQFRAEVTSKVEYINLDNPSDTGWDNTQIVKLLRLAETNTDKIGDMTLLARAGEFIKSQYPECTPKKYGIKTLKGVLKVSGLFEIIESQNVQQNGVSVLYKSKVLQ
ncbi:MULTISPECIES: OST-HTH/LOTUS domain-containing protein [unclassified Tolypothrix]|uniref:OST-HTH/LOTUS domain-containing protein n=1 Tax=unclassified Tolypothrix TaxID=2649714 RepID=UPI0005EAC5F9|nr:MULTISPECIES: OST-HTH/LOTUS domain-containing protein [unclassified Tolypothrix]BAY91369.1 hypothetical protein NIES3275_33920 [Microchaete diplosiphon NIES-3275]EKF04502.1 hypothetical protein FDUTEX481_01771 [Tolypothrix sp. PCC 7601]MBE9080944.1 OST-HTH/LOTUS domain-containing protein [Tolypothrix sp. LEGE 11397]UYD25422.1 OST-HTH/LOTUS domain-containing protein [Tolypothrix sp. PCC 7712]UYD32333.1 OST-HTH/LOTUS domain-containing protein [Tolypothrix sp. PCC 7601]